MRTALFAWLVAGTVLSSGSTFAGEGSSLRGLKPPSDATEGEKAADQLSGGPPGLKWRYVSTLPELAPRLSLLKSVQDARQFASDTIRFSTSRYRPIGRTAAAAGTESASLLDYVLPRYTLYSQGYRSLPGGWGLGLGVRQSEYSFATANLLALTAGRDWGNFRGAYTLYSNSIDGNGLGAAHRFQVNYFYGERNTIGLAYTTGRDVESLALSAGLQLNDARDVTLSGRHWLSPNWALTYDVLSHEQSNLYRRQGLRLGVSRSF